MSNNSSYFINSARCHVEMFQGSQLGKLRATGFHIGYFTQDDPRLLSVNNTSNVASVPVHYVFERDGHAIQLVVFYERGHGRYWWHGQVGEKQELLRHKGDVTINPSELLFGQHAGAYDRYVYKRMLKD